MEQALDHELDLLFGGEAVAYDGGFDGERGVLCDRLVAGSGSQHRDSANLTQFEGRLGIRGEEDFFDGDDVGVMELDLGDEFGVDLREALGCCVFLVQPDSAVCDVVKLRGAGSLVELHDAVAGKFRAAVNSEDSHGVSLPQVERGGFAKAECPLPFRVAGIRSVDC